MDALTATPAATRVVDSGVEIDVADVTDAGCDAVGRHAAAVEAGESALLAVPTATQKRTRADLLRQLVGAADSGAAAPTPRAPRRSR
ncbi:hypothetical protein ABZ612_12810 [Streptomyces avermitilis]|uniref:hypothetical protein n=1 Tax=Streptomyces avermitilis TaxID=33903 RepID=UPI00340117C2